MAVTKIIELVGSSQVSSDDAVQQALSEARKTLRNIKAVDVVSIGLRGSDLQEWRAHVRLSFLIEGGGGGGAAEQPTPPHKRGRFCFTYRGTARPGVLGLKNPGGSSAVGVGVLPTLTITSPGLIPAFAAGPFATTALT